MPNLLGSIIRIAMANHPDERLQWPAPERNKSFILEVLRDVLLETILDGREDAFEKNLIQRVAGLIFVSDKDRGVARKRVMARLGIAG